MLLTELSCTGELCVWPAAYQEKQCKAHVAHAHFACMHRAPGRGVSVQVMQIEGWRFAMRAVSCVSFTVAALVAVFAADPRVSRGALPPPDTPHSSSVRSSLQHHGEFSESKRSGDGGAWGAAQSVGGGGPFAEATAAAAPPRAAAARAAAGGGDKAGVFVAAGEAAAAESHRRSHDQAHREAYDGGGGGGEFEASKGGGNGGMLASLVAAAKSIGEIMRIRTFQIIVAQGIVGTALRCTRLARCCCAALTPWTSAPFICRQH